MPDQTPPPSATTPTAPSSQLPETERRKLEALIARSEPRYSADAQGQAQLERLRRLFRALFMRLDHGRWRVSKTKGIAWLTIGVAALAFWNYLPRPNFTSSVDAPGFQVGASITPSAQPPTATRAPQPLEQPDGVVSVPPRLPAPRLESNPPDASSPASVVPNAASEMAYKDINGRPASGTSRVALPTASSYQGFESIPAARLEDPLLSSSNPPIARVSTAQKPLSIPVPLVERPSLSGNLPKALVDREMERSGSPFETTVNTYTQDTNASPEATENAPNPNTIPLIDPRDESESLGQAGALVDVPRADTSRQLSSNTAPTPESGVLFDVAPNSISSANTGTSATPSAPKSSSSYLPGTQISAKLMVGVIVIANQESPVVAQLQDGAVVFGKATLAGSRVQITLLEIVKNGISSAVNASSVGADGFPGIATTLREDSPDVVSRLWQAGLQGVSSYAQSVIKGATTTVLNGVTSVTTPEPNLVLSLLESLAETFLAPKSGTLVRYAQLEPTTVFQVLFLPTR
ncbi:MAG: hypothetical protein HC933_04400 [Pleurocapsa sp. SU_196_0]|nr:hypothetical protein [Pleurocapsa sp. SU_196_0]